MTMSAALDATRRLKWGPSEENRRSRSCGRRRRTADVLSRWIGPERIEMLKRRHGYFPQTFLWRGRRYDISMVQRCWTITRRGLYGKVERHYFRVLARTAAERGKRRATFEIYQDLHDSTWYLERRAT